MAKTENIVVNLLCIIIAVVTIVGNALVCHIILRVKSMKTSMNYLLLNLAILDAITGFVAIFYAVINDAAGLFGTPRILHQAYNQSALAAEVLCKLVNGLWLGSTITPLFLMAIAYERYKAVVHPLTRRDSLVTKGRLKWILPLAWLLGFGFLSTDLVLGTYSEGTCKDKSYSWYNFKAYTAVYVTTLYIIPSIVISTLYYRVIRSLRKTEIIAAQAELQRARSKARKKVILVIITVTLTFYIFCGLPHMLYLVNDLFELSFWQNVGEFPLVLISLNSALNPLIYFIFIKSFRDGLRSTCKSSLQDTNNCHVVNITTAERNAGNSNSLNQQNDSNSGEPKLLVIRFVDENPRN